MKDSKFLAVQVSWFSLAQVAVILVPLLSLPIVIRILGLDGYGDYAIVLAKAALLTILANLGLDISAVQIAKRKRLFLNSFYNIQALKLIAGLFWTGLFILFELIQGNKVLEIPHTVLLALGQISFPTWYFIATQNGKAMAIFTLLGRLIFLTLIGIVYLIDINLSVTDVVFFTVLSFFIASFASNMYVFRRVQQKMCLRFWLIKKVFLFSMGFYCSRVAVAAYTNLNIIVLGAFATSTAAGAFAIGEKLYQAVQMFYRPLMNVLYPFFSNEAKRRKYFRDFLLVLVVFNFVGVGVIGFFCEPLILMLGITPTVQIMDTVQLFLMSLLVLLPSIVVGYPYLGNMGRSSVANGTLVFFGVIHLLMLFAIVNLELLTSVSVATAVLVTETGILVTRMFYIVRIYFGKNN